MPPNLRDYVPPSAESSEEAARRERSENLSRLLSSVPCKSTRIYTAPFRKPPSSRKPFPALPPTPSKPESNARNESLQNDDALIQREERRVQERMVNGRTLKERRKKTERDREERKKKRKIEQGERAIEREKSVGLQYGRKDNGWRGEIEMVVSDKMELGIVAQEDVLEGVRMVFGEGVVVKEKGGIVNLIKWKRRGLRYSGELVDWNVVVLAGEIVMEYMEGGVLKEYVEFLMREVGGKVVLVVVGIEQEVKKRRGRTMMEGRGFIVGRESVGDCFNGLLHEFGVRIIELNNGEEVAGYLIGVTKWIAKEPYHRRNRLLEVGRQYQRNRGVIAETVMDQGGDIRREVGGELGWMYIKVLMQLGEVSAVKARAIGRRFPTLGVLMGALAECESEEGKIELLANVECGGGGKLGRVIAKGLVSNLTSTDKDLVFQN